MAKPRGWKPTLRYSPVNGMIVDWGINGEPFSMCCLPAKNCEAPTPVAPAAGCDACEPIVEAVDTYDWYRWVPEIIVGLSGANEDMAASYARRAAIMFATGARVLRRKVAITLQPGVFRYPIDTFDDERAVGVASIDSAMGACQCEGNIGQQAMYVGRVHVDKARQEIVLSDTTGACGCHVSARGPKHLLATVWATPTEDSCRHDAFLYETYRAEIAKGARSMFMEEAHSYGSYQTNRGQASARGDSLMFNRADRGNAEFQRAIRRALVDIETEGIDNTPVPSMWASGCCNNRTRR